jgi:hypothetical protein
MDIYARRKSGGPLITTNIHFLTAAISTTPRLQLCFPNSNLSNNSNPFQIRLLQRFRGDLILPLIPEVCDIRTSCSLSFSVVLPFTSRHVTSATRPIERVARGQDTHHSLTSRLWRKHQTLHISRFPLSFPRRPLSVVPYWPFYTVQYHL